MFEERGLKWPWDREEEEKTPDEDPEHQSDEEGVTEAVEAVVEEAEGKPAEEAKAPEVRAAACHHAHRCSLDGGRKATIHASAPDAVQPRWSVPDGARRYSSPVMFGAEHYSLVASRVPAPEQETSLLEGLDEF